MSEDRALIVMDMGQYRGMSLELPRSEAENLVMTGQARWQTRPLPNVETPESPNLAALSRDELADLANARGLAVTRADGKSTQPRKADYLRALEG